MARHRFRHLHVAAIGAVATAIGLIAMLAGVSSADTHRQERAPTTPAGSKAERRADRTTADPAPRGERRRPPREPADRRRSGGRPAETPAVKRGAQGDSGGAGRAEAGAGGGEEVRGASAQAESTAPGPEGTPSAVAAAVCQSTPEAVGGPTANRVPGTRAGEFPIVCPPGFSPPAAVQPPPAARSTDVRGVQFDRFSQVAVTGGPIAALATLGAGLVVVGLMLLHWRPDRRVTLNSCRGEPIQTA